MVTIIHWNVIMLFVFGLILLNKKQNAITRKIFVILMTLQFILINGLRHFSVGVDSVVYYWRFEDAANVNSIKELLNLNRFEPGYTILQGLIGFLTDNYAVFFMVISIIIFIPLSIFIYKYSENYFLSFFSYIVLRLFDFSMNGVRQSIAMSIALLSFKYALEKQLKKFLIVVFIATLFHYSALIILPVYLLVNITPKIKHLYLIGITYIIFYLSKGFIANLLSELYYAYDPSFMREYEPSGIGMTGLFILGIAVLGAIIHDPFNQKSGKKTNALFYITIASFFIHSISTYSYLFKRLNYYYLIFIIIYIPELFKETKTFILPLNDKYNFTIKDDILMLIQKGLKISMIILLTIYYISIINRDYFGLLPYGMFFEEFEYVLNRFL